MKHLPSGPADTRMMVIVHDALRRDLDRAVVALSNTPVPNDDQRDAIGEHVRWMMAFLDAHHRGEDAGLWPNVRARSPRAAALVDEMTADHAVIAPLVEVCAEASRRYRDDASDDARRSLLDSIVSVRAALLPHLQREEDEVLPVVSVALSNDEWRAIDQEYFIEPKSRTQLAREGHWLLDGLDPARRDIVVHQVPSIQRFVLVHGYARRYRRQADRCWNPGGASPEHVHSTYGPSGSLARRIPSAGVASAVVDAPIEAVWRVVSDVTRVGEWSHECHRVEWMDGAASAAEGVRFRGVNKAGPWTWSRVNEILVVDAPHTFVWRTVPTLLFPDSSEWSFSLEPVGQKTRIVQQYRLLRAPALLARLYAIVVPSHRDRSTGLTDDLRRIGQVAAAECDAAVAR